MNSIEIAEKANKILSDSGLFSAPIDLTKLALHLDVMIHKEELEDEISGMLVIKDGYKHIIINKNQHPNRQRFTIAHEMGHLTLHHQDGDQLFVDNKMAVYHRVGTPSHQVYSSPGSLTNPAEEKEANYFAASLLVPEALLRSYIDSRQLDISDELDVYLLANAFGVSEQAMSIRLQNLGLIRFSYE